MAAGIEIYNYVTNQKGSPAIYSDTLANRPAAGFIGRLFVSTDTLEIYRDNGTTWDLISGGGGPSVNIYNSNGTLTGARTMTMGGNSLTFEGGASTTRLVMSANNNIPRVFSFRTADVARWEFRVDDNETGGNTGANWHLRAHNDAGTFTFNPISVTRSNGEKSFYAQENLTAGTEALAGVFNISAGTYGAGLTFIGGNAHAAQFNNFTIANGGSFTFASSSFVGASGNVLRVQANASGTVTMTPSSPGIRTAAVMLNQIQYNTSGGRNLVYTHAANIQTLGILQLIIDGSFTVTNAYGLIINDLNEYNNPAVGPGALILTNRWGIYQDSTTDVNYFGGTTLIGTTTNAGFKLDVNGAARINNALQVNKSDGGQAINIVGNTNTASIQQNGSDMYFNSNTNTTGGGFFFRNSSSFNTRMAIDASGNVGIGTTSPTQALSIVRGAGLIGGISLRGNNNDAANEFFVGQGSAGNAFLAQRANADLLFSTNNTTRLYIFAGGNVGINTTTDAGQRLQIDSSLRLVPTSTVPTASAGAMYYDSATNKLKLYDGTSWVALN